MINMLMIEIREFITRGITLVGAAFDRVCGKLRD
jgi:hypothetical protein